MKTWFFADNQQGEEGLFRTADVRSVRSAGDGVLIGFADGSAFETQTYDLRGFVSNVFENDGTLVMIDDLSE